MARWSIPSCAATTRTSSAGWTSGTKARPSSFCSWSTRAIRTDSSLQLAGYALGLWQRHLDAGGGLPLPPVVPMVLYHGTARWSVPSDLAGLLRRPKALESLAPSFPYLLTDLSRLSDEEIHGPAPLRAAMLALRHIFDHDLRGAVLGILKLLEREGDVGRVEHLLVAVLHYVSAASDRLSREDLSTLVKATFPDPQGENLMATAAEEWIEEGRREGRQEGMRLGALVSAREAVLEVLDVRFEPVPDPVVRRIHELGDPAILHTLLRAALTAATIGDFRRALENVQATPSD